jgi:AAA+ superfamily predicted ATPase
MNHPNQQITIIDAIEFVFLHKEEFQPDNVSEKSLCQNIQYVVDFFEITKPMALVVSVITYNQILGETIPFKKLLKGLGFTPKQAIEILGEIRTLKIKGWLIGSRNRFSSNNNSYELSANALQAVISGNKEDLSMPTCESQVDALVETSKLLSLYSHEEDKDIILEVLFEQISCYKHFPVFDKIFNDKELDSAEKGILIWMASQYVLGFFIMDIAWAVEKIFGSVHWLKNFKNRISTDGYLIHQKYIAFDDTGFADFSNVFLGDAVTELIDVSKEKIKRKPIFNLCDNILPTQTQDMQLFFNSNNTAHIEELKAITNTEAYERIVTNFKKHGMSSGIAVLLSGAPGTGKTETVKQLAKEQDRMLLMVDISKFKSMWLGESEKNIKKIFKEYAAACHYYENKPILLLNEADAILGTRIRINSSIDQTMNNIQNILLQELEDFEGILMATTNLTENLDPAFDRRFIMKFKFELPNVETRYKIIQKQFPELSEEFCQLFANEYILSGAQIQNIRRRILAKQIVFQDYILDKSSLEKMAMEETNQKANNIVGYLRKSG